MKETKGIRQDRLKLRFSKPDGKISRRDLLKLVVPRYEVVPFIDSVSCRGSQECGLCLASCPLKAIKVETGAVTVDTTLCSGCGACLDACPFRAIVYPTYSLEHLDKEIEELLAAEGVSLEPGIIAFTCRTCLPVSDEEGVEQSAYPAGVVPLKVPCLAMASPWLLLRAFDRGVSGLALVYRQGKCPVGFDSNRWQQSIRFVQALLGGWDIEPERIRVFDVADDSRTMEQELDRFAREMTGSGPTLLKGTEPVSVPPDGLLLPALIKGLRDKLGSPSKGAVTDGMVPFAKLALDGSQCIGCGLCARDCPTEALTALSSEESGDYQLLFQHDLCIACGKCEEVCPEKCIGLERILEMDRLGGSTMVLFEDKIARCRECGSVIGPGVMIDRVRAKLQVMGDPVTSQLELCPECKVKANFGPGRAAEGPSDKSD